MRDYVGDALGPAASAGDGGLPRDLGQAGG